MNDSTTPQSTFRVAGTSGSLPVHVFRSPEAAGAAVAREVLHSIMDSAARGQAFHLGLPTGSTPMPLFAALADALKLGGATERDAVARSLRVVVMDDFVLPSSGQNLPPDHEWSAVGFMQRTLLQSVNDGVGYPLLRPESVLFPTVGNVGALRDSIIRGGGIDLQVLATDPFDGHVAQNFPGDAFRRNEEQKAGPLRGGFLTHHPWASVFHGVTFDLSDFTEQVRANPRGKVFLLVFGEAKARTLQRLLAARTYDPMLPASFVWLLSDRCQVFADAHAHHLDY